MIVPTTLNKNRAEANASALTFYGHFEVCLVIDCLIHELIVAVYSAIMKRTWLDGKIEAMEIVDIQRN